MRIKEIKAEIILDSRQEHTIEVSVNGSKTSAPSGKSKGKHEKPCYKKNIDTDIKFINKTKPEIFPEITCFEDLEKIEAILKKKIGANTLYAFEASCLKALAKENEKELWQIMNPNLNLADAKFPRILSNTIGGGAHSHTKIKPDFQEFLFTSDKDPSMANFINKKCHERASAILTNLISTEPKLNDENALQCDFDNEKVLEVMKDVQEKVFEESTTHVDIGIDIAGSQFFHKTEEEYNYRNRIQTLDREEQIDYIIELAKKYNLFYIEDPLEEEDFQGFRELNEKAGCLIVGDDLTVTNLERVKKAISMKSISGLIIKPNQTGSLIEVKNIFDLCKENIVTTIVSHRSGETSDSTIADIAFAFQADFIKTSVIGKEREAKVNRLKEIEAKREV